MSAENERATIFPPLPKMLPQPAPVGSGDTVQWYTSDQMRAYGEACAKAERERICAANPAHFAWRQSSILNERQT